MLLEQESRVPYFFFTNEESGEDKEASEKLGYPVPKIVTYINVIPHGSKGATSVFIADEYIARKSKEAHEKRYDPKWVKEYKDGLALFLEGKAVPRNGTPLISYERIAKARREALAVQFPTVEDLAAVPDSSLGDIGLDGRVIRDLARGDIQAKKDLSPVVRELADANETIRRQEEQITKLSARLDVLEEVKTRKKHAEVA
jgi:hypothetical protein